MDEQTELRELRSALLMLTVEIHMRLSQNDRNRWICPICKGANKNLTALEEAAVGSGHHETCAYAKARQLIADYICSDSDLNLLNF